MATYDNATGVTGSIGVCKNGDSIQIRVGTVVKNAPVSGSSIGPVVFNFQPSGGDGNMAANFTQDVGYISGCTCVVTVSGSVVGTNHIQLTVSGSCIECEPVTTYDPGTFSVGPIDFFLDGNELCSL